MAVVCPHYYVSLLVEAENHEHFGIYAQAFKLMVARYGLQLCLTDISCRMEKAMAALSAYLVDSGESALPPLVQSLFHGLFHEWMCLVIRGAPWNVELGRVTGEESERFFSMLGKLDNALSQSARGRRCYVLHSFVAYYNTNKAMAMHTFLQTRFDRIICELNQHLDELRQADPMSLELYKSDIVKLQVSQALIAKCMHACTNRTFVTLYRPTQGSSNFLEPTRTRSQSRPSSNATRSYNSTLLRSGLVSPVQSPAGRSKTLRSFDIDTRRQPPSEIAAISCVWRPRQPATFLARTKNCGSSMKLARPCVTCMHYQTAVF